MSTRKALLLAAVVVALALLVGCGRTYPPGPAGTVTDRTHRYYKASGWRYWLTVTTPTGTAQRFRVTRGDYRNCFHQSHYPACTTRSTHPTTLTPAHPQPSRDRIRTTRPTAKSTGSHRPARPAHRRTAR